MLNIICFLLIITGCFTDDFSLDENLEFPENFENKHFKNVTLCMLNTELNSIICHG